ncbi:nitroreductase family protein [Nocardioides sp.]|uniref:nitroreductase family protein n=1 Tax=Nocardioides sp. TaxID=35761 RepID=UPI0035160D22
MEQPARINHPDLAEPLRSRWSPSVFDAAHEIAAADVELLLEAARWAPSAGNRQPWRYLVLPRGSAGHAALVEHLSRGNAGWVPRASLLLVSTIARGADGNDFGDLHVPLHDLGQATAHLTLQAHAMGLHVHQFAGFDHAAVAAALGVPDDALVLAGIAVGRRGDAAEVDPRDAEREQRERVRRPLGEIAFGDRWGEAWTPAEG